MLTVTNQIEPFTDSSKAVVPVFAESDSYRRLLRDLRRYTNGQIQGRSYLIAGHRGSGKSMLVHKVIEDLLRECLDKSHRPLFVRLHGPDLLPPVINVTQSNGTDPAAATPPANQIAIAFSGGSPASVNAFPQSSGVDNTDAEMVNVLIQMMRSLFRDVTNEFRKCFREAILRTNAGVRRQELLEIAAQFDLEMLDGLTAARLREYWQRINKLATGVLFTNDRSKYVVFSAPGLQPEDLLATDLGMQEILALTFLSQAFQVVSGKIEEKQQQKDAAKDEITSTLSTAYAVKDFLAPVIGLISGGAVGIAVGGGGNPYAAVVSGLVTGSLVSLGFTYTRSRAKNREISSESIFIKDRSVATLSGVLPLLVLRLRQIGLVPVFVIDELDKVDEIEERMRKLVKHLKYLVTENSFTCFLTDRRYYNYVERQAKQTPYAAEYTYFSDRLLVLYEPADLREFVRALLQSAEPSYGDSSADATQVDLAREKDRQDIEKISYVVLHRARMHPIDLRRQIDRLATKQIFSMTELFPAPRYRFEVMIQLAIEWLLGGEDVRTQTGGDSDSRQLLYDSLYYVSRLWEDASTGERMLVPGFKNFGEKGEDKPGFVLEKQIFATYLASRYAPDNQTRTQDGYTKQNTDAATVADKLPEGTDFDFLFRKVKELLNWLSNPEGLYDELMRSTRSDTPPRFIIDEIPTTTPLLQKEGSGYQWLYDTSGRYLEARDVASIISDIRKPLGFIRQIEKYLRQIASLQLFADLGIIPRTLEWRNVEPMLARLQRMINDQRTYDRMSADRDSVLEFAEILKEFEPHLKAAVMCASLLLPDVPTTAGSGTPEGETARFERGLTHVAQLLRITAADDDLDRMNSVLRSTDVELPPVPSDAKWEQVMNLARNWQKRATSPQTEEVEKSSWDLFKERFSARFRDRTGVFEPRLGDLVTQLRQFGAGGYLTFELSSVTIARWTELLLRSLESRGVPKWVRVPAALELGFPQLAEALCPSLDADIGIGERWIKDFRAATPNVPSTSERRAVLIITPQGNSLTSSWKPSSRHAALACSATDFNQLRSKLRPFKIIKPADIPIDSICIELKGTRETLVNFMDKKPAEALAAMASTSTGPPPKDLEPFLNLPARCYLAPEFERTVVFSVEIPFVGARSLDELVDKAWGQPVVHLPNPTASQKKG